MQTQPAELGSWFLALRSVGGSGAQAERGSAWDGSFDENPGVGEVSAVVGELRNGIDGGVGSSSDRCGIDP
jgi:hypothetical protein